ncbi:MAG: hypothetical protein ACM3X7_10350 [Solirubrobacterales bacterium]
MGKPSIFSRDYEKKMRRRRIRNLFSVIAVVIIIAAGIAMYKTQFNSNTKKPVTQNTQKSEKPKVEVENQTQTPIVKEEGFDFKLDDGTSLKAVYTVNGDSKAFKYLSPKESGTYYNVNPSGNKMVVYDNKVQKMILIDITGTITDITNPSYTSSSGYVITKESVLSQNNSYIWCDTPTFVDDSNIAYISQLPWLNRTTKFVWIENVDSKQNVYINSIGGENVKFDTLDSKGLGMTIDGSLLYLSPNGGVTQ